MTLVYPDQLEKKVLVNQFYITIVVLVIYNVENILDGEDQNQKLNLLK